VKTPRLFKQSRLRTDKATAIYIAAQRGSTESVQLLLDHGADPNVAYKTGCTPIGISAQNGHADCLSLFLKHDQVDSNASDTSSTFAFLDL